jgi:hypothetical protein
MNDNCLKVCTVDDLLSSAEVAEELDLDEWALRRKLRKGIVKGQKIGRSWVIAREEVERLRGEELDRRKASALNSRWK